MELRQSDKLVLKTLQSEGLHFDEHLLKEFKRQVLQNVADPLQLLFDDLLLRLVPDGRHYVGEDAKLVEVAQLDSKLVQLLHLLLRQLKYEGHAFETVAHELRQVVKEVLVDELQVGLKVLSNLVQVEEDLLKVLFDKGQ